MIQLIIADDHALFADGLEQILAGVPGFEVMAKVNNGKLLLQTLNRKQPDLILLDINMPYLDGVSAAIQIKKQWPRIKIVLLSMYYDAKIMDIVKANELNGFIIKEITAPELKNAILKVIAGEQIFILPEAMMNKQPHFLADNFAEKFKLSTREIEIINLIKIGKSNKQIAIELSLSSYTIETHRKNIYRKLDLQGTAELISFATTHNL